MSDQLNAPEDVSVKTLPNDTGKSEPLVTPKNVALACEAIQARGERVTTDRVRAHLGGGSPNAVLPLVREWKTANRPSPPTIGSETTRPVEPKKETDRQIVSLETLPAVNEALESLTTAFLDALSTIQTNERTRADAQIQAMQETTTRQNQAERERAQKVIEENAALAATQIEDAQIAESELANSLSDALEDNRKIQGEKVSLANENARLSALLEEKQGKIDDQEDTISKLAGTLNEITADRDKLKQDLEASKTRIQDLEGDRAEHSQRLTDVTKERDKLADDVGKVRDRVEALHDQVTEAKSALARTEAQRDSALERLDECKAERKADRKADPTAP